MTFHFIIISNNFLNTNQFTVELSGKVPHRIQKLSHHVNVVAG